MKSQRQVYKVRFTLQNVTRAIEANSPESAAELYTIQYMNEVLDYPTEGDALYVTVEWGEETKEYLVVIESLPVAFATEV